MSCFFCNSNLHLSPFCHIHKSKKSRSKIVCDKNLCKVCRNKCILDYPFACKCYMCYSRDHNTLFCKADVAQLFIPKIDEILLLRFMQTFDPVEQIHLTFCKQDLEIYLKHVAILDIPTFEYTNTSFPSETDAIIYNYHTFEENGRNFLDTVKSKIFYVFSNIIILRNLQLSSNEFLSLLSFNTVELNCYFVTVITEVKFSNILFATKNIEKIDFHETNIVIENNWPKMLLKYLNTNLFRNLQITVNTFDFDVEELVKFMKKNATINISLNIDNSMTLQEMNIIIKEKFCQRFKKIKKLISDKKWITLRFIQRKEDMLKIIHSIGSFALKNI